MDDFLNFLDIADSNAACGDDSLAIPEPKPNGDIRPNPFPMQASAPVTLDRGAADRAANNEERVVKSINFYDNTDQEDAAKNPSDPATFTVRAEDKAADFMPLQTSDSGNENDAKCFAFMGASGGAGVTTLCIQMAYDIAKRTKKSTGFGAIADPTVCIIDLDFETGSCASYLDVPPALTIDDICGPPDRIDASIVQALMSHHESGIAVISTPNALGANTLAKPETVLALLDAASQVYDHIILDLPRIWQPWIGAAIAGADHFALVGELTIPSLHTARARIANIEKVLGARVNCEIVLNKVERRSFRNSVRLADAEKALQRSVSATICVDYDTTREAINCGEAVQVIRPEARYVKDVRLLSLLWAPVRVTGKKAAKERRKSRTAA